MPALHRSNSPPPLMVHFLMVLCATLVSTSFIVGKAITQELDPAPLTLIRFSCAALLFMPYVASKYGLRWPSGNSLMRYGIISGTLVAFFWLMFLSLRYTSPLHTGVLFTLVPGISSIFSAILLKERLGIYRLTCLVLAMIGALWVIFKGEWDLVIKLELGKGDLIFFGACLFMALYTPLIKILHRGEPMAVMTFWILVTGSGWLFLFTGYRLPQIEWSGVPSFVWGGILYLAIFTTVTSFFISQWATLHIGPTRVLAYSYLYPPLIICLEWLLGHPLPSLKTALGVVLIVPAMFILQRGADPNKFPLK